MASTLNLLLCYASTSPPFCLTSRIAAWSPAEKALALTSTLTLIGLPVLATTAWAAWQDSPKSVLDEAWQIVQRSYVDPTFNQVDWVQERQSLLGLGIHLFGCRLRSAGGHADQTR